MIPSERKGMTLFCGKKPIYIITWKKFKKGSEFYSLNYLHSFRTENFRSNAEHYSC